MSDLSTFIPWLLLGGLVVVCMGIAAIFIALRQLQRSLAEQSEKIGAMLRFQADFPARLAKQTLSPDLAEIGGLLRQEWSAFQAIYRADMATTVAEARLSEFQNGQAETPMAQDSLDRAILMAQAGRSAQSIAAECGIGPIDAEALVHFHQPLKSLAS